MKAEFIKGNKCVLVLEDGKEISITELVGSKLRLECSDVILIRPEAHNSITIDF